MTELMNIFITLFYAFLAAMFLIITRAELKRGETLIKTSFAVGTYFVILTCLSIMQICGIIDMSLVVFLVFIIAVIYLIITVYAFKYVKSTAVYSWTQKVE